MRNRTTCTASAAWEEQRGMALSPFPFRLLTWQQCLTRTSHPSRMGLAISLVATEKEKVIFPVSYCHHCVACDFKR